MRMRGRQGQAATDLEPSKIKMWQPLGLALAVLLRAGVGPKLTAAQPQTDEEPLQLPELKTELADLLMDIPNRGCGADKEDAEDLLDIVVDMTRLNPNPEWDIAPCLAASYKLRYTSSKAFHTNQGLIGYAQSLNGITTPELTMSIQTQYRLLTFTEPITYDQGSVAAFIGNLAGAQDVSAECSWTKNAAGAMLVTANAIRTGQRSWVPADKQAKSLRVMAACTPIFLDENFFILRGQIAEVLFVFERVAE